MVLACARVQSGELPRMGNPPVWAGAGTGEACSLCEATITAQETGYELAVIPGGRVAPQELRFHIDCHTAWVFACKEPPHGQAE